MKGINNYRDLFSGIETPIRLPNGSIKVPINFDNGATTPPFKYVERILKESISMYGAIHRGGQKALYSTQTYDSTKFKVLEFFGLSVRDGYSVIYIKNTTEGMNLLANELCNKSGVKVLATRMEHHANDLPWRKVATMFYVDVDERGILELDTFEEKLAFSQGTISYVTVTYASNVTGYITPIHKIAQIVHKYGAKLIVDAAQLVAHQSIDIKGKQKDEAIDFLVFSAHKMYAPFGTGVIVAKTDALEQAFPYILGGGAVTAVLDDDVYFKHSPDKEEAGTPNFLGVMALSAAIDMLKKIGMDNVKEHEQLLKKRLLNGLCAIPKVQLYGEAKYEQRLGVIPFNIRDRHHIETMQLLADKGGIAVRNGCFCAQPYVSRLLKVSDKERYYLMSHPEMPQPGMVRASLGLYNTEKEVDDFLEWVEWLCM